MGKIALYTVLTNGYDDVPPLSPHKVPGIDCFLVTDDPDLEIPEGHAWQKMAVPKEDDPHRHQRRLKLRFHDLFPDYDTVIYLDANIHLTYAVKHILPFHKGGMTTCVHPHRICVYQEGEACEKLGKAPVHEIRKQMAAYRKEGIPVNAGMFQTGFIIRSNTPEVRAYCEAWHDELSEYTHRDQLSMMPVAIRRNFEIAGIRWGTFTRFARLVKHTGNSRKYSAIHYLTPYATDGNIGRALNEAISLIPSASDWVVIRDGDTSFTVNHWGKQIEHVLHTHGDKYAIYGAMTNRIRSKHQRIEGMFDEFDMREHWKTGEKLEYENYGRVKDGGTGVAGFFMAFRKSTWEKTPFRENEKTFDTLFCKDVRKAGGKIGLMTGVYIFHFYRPLSDDPANDTSHLDIVGRG